MALRAYLVPLVTATIGGRSVRVPKYIDGAIASNAWQGLPYGNEPTMLVLADVTPTEHAAIAANADVVAAPATLDNTIGAQLVTVQNALESVNVPGSWVTAGMTYRAVLRWVARLFFITQRFNGLAGGVALFALVANLDALVSAIPAQRRAQLVNAAQSFGLDTSGVTLSMTIRQALLVLGNQMTMAWPLLEAQ